MTNDFYCEEVLSGRTAVETVRETGRVLAFRHTRPHWPVHVVVVPKQHVESLLVCEDDGLLSELLAVVRRVAEDIVGERGACRVVTNLGDYQDSKHLHWHVGWGEATR